MKKVSIKKTKYVAIASVVFLMLAFFVRAEDDERDDEEDYRPSASQTSSESSSSSSKSKPVTTTTTTTKNIIIKDSDGDGLPDGQDPHPNIAEIYIVKDDNHNGIVDTFEKPAQ